MSATAAAFAASGHGYLQACADAMPIPGPCFGIVVAKAAAAA
jgi:hypothetical protein